MPDIIFYFLLVSLIIFSCLFYGSVTAFPLAVTEAGVSLTVLFWLSEMSYRRSIHFLKTGPLIPILSLLALLVLQLIPLPISLIKIISPNSAYLYENFIPSVVSKRLFTLSICPNITLSELFKFLTYMGVFFLIVNKLETKKQFDWIVNTIIFFGFIISLFGIIQKYAYPGRVYWFDPQGSAGSAFGPFVNRNNFCGYINMIIPLALGYFLTEMSLSKRLIYGFFLGIMSLALFLSLSRAGVLVYIVVLVFIISLSRLKDNFKSKTKTLYLWAFLILSSLIFITESKAIINRLSTLFHKNAFVVLGHGYSWLDILGIWRDFPLFGTGLGTFGNISSMYKTNPAQSLFIYAHNDCLQLLSEVGLLGFISVSLFFVLYFNSVLRMWLRRHDSYTVCLALGGMASVLGMLLYSLLDFNLHIPANAMLFFLIMGLVYRLLYTRFNHDSSLSK